MTTICLIIAAIIGVLWVCISIAVLISTIQVIDFARRGEERDREYHRKRMREFR